jgi:hypothetical protein
MLASILIACNLGCNPWCENKVLVPILFLKGGFHFNHLYKCHVTLDVTFCIITKLMNKWMFIFCKKQLSLFCIVFTLYKAYIIFYWTCANI